jgi:hypothetical protein
MPLWHPPTSEPSPPRRRHTGEEQCIRSPRRHRGPRTRRHSADRGRSHHDRPAPGTESVLPSTTLRARHRVPMQMWSRHDVRTANLQQQDRDGEGRRPGPTGRPPLPRLDPSTGAYGRSHPARVWNFWTALHTCQGRTLSRMAAARCAASSPAKLGSATVAVTGMSGSRQLRAPTTTFARTPRAC